MKTRSKTTLSHCQQALGFLTKMFHHKMVLYLLRVFFRSFEVFLLFSNLCSFSTFSLFVFLFLLSLFLWQFKEEFYAISFEKGRYCQQPFLAIFLVYKFPVFPKCSESREMCEFMATLLLAPEGSAASSCWAIVQPVRFTRYWQWTSRNTQSLPVLLSQLSVTYRRISCLFPSRYSIG